MVATTKMFIAKYNSWKREENLENIKKVVVEFERRVNTEVRRQEKLNMVEERNFRRGKLPRKYMAKILYRWNNKKIKKEYLRKLEKNWQKWKLVSPEEKL